MARVRLRIERRRCAQRGGMSQATRRIFATTIFVLTTVI
jgi:hypothetical protein